jgi:hypothetical protein
MTARPGPAGRTVQYERKGSGAGGPVPEETEDPESPESLEDRKPACRAPRGADWNKGYGDRDGEGKRVNGKRPEGRPSGMTVMTRKSPPAGIGSGPAVAGRIRSGAREGPGEKGRQDQY